MTRHFAGKVRTSLGRKYRVLIETGLDIATEWGVSDGIQTARIETCKPERPSKAALLK
jgi:hypothetical protein